MWGFQSFMRKQKIHKAIVFAGRPTIISMLMTIGRNKVATSWVDEQCRLVLFDAPGVTVVKSISNAL